MIKEATDLLAQILNKNLPQTFIVIEEVDPNNWGIAGMTVSKYRSPEQAVENHAVG